MGGGRGGERGTRKTLWTSFVLSFFLIFLVTHTTACPIVCICKWKGGKQTVSCRNQGLETLPDGIDPETQVLDISGNKLGVLPRDAFRRAGLLNLQKIHVSNARITQVDAGAFSELINLVEIDLSDNQLTSVPSQAFKETPFIRDLNLGGNPIKRLKNGAFRHLPQLVKLDLSRCHISEVEDQAFAHLQSLETLKLNSNLLPLLSNNTVRSLSQLHGIELHDNPWECNCKLRDLKVWLENKNIPYPISPTCHGPPRLTGRKFDDLPISEFACSPRIIPYYGNGGGGSTPGKIRQVQVFEGENATFDCAFEGVPQPAVRWYLFGRPITNNTMLSFNRKFFIFEDAGRSTLVLTNTNGKDGGDFFCVVENAAGFVEANFSLEILPPPAFQDILETSQVFIVVLSVIIILILLAVAVALFIWYKWRIAKQRAHHSYKGNGHGPTANGTGGGGSTPNHQRTPVKSKPDRTNNSYDNYEINPGSLITQNGFKPGHNNKEGDPGDNPDLIMETTNNTSNLQGNYRQELINSGEDESVNSELNWEGASLSYRNLGYATEYPPDYGLPIIHENSVYSDSHSHSSYYGGGGSGPSLPLPPLPLSNGSLNNVNNVNLPLSNSNTVMSGVWNKNKVGARITAPNARDSPDEGYQEGESAKNKHEQESGGTRLRNLGFLRPPLIITTTNERRDIK